MQEPFSLNEGILEQISTNFEDAGDAVKSLPANKVNQHSNRVSKR